MAYPSNVIPLVGLPSPSNLQANFTYRKYLSNENANESQEGREIKENAREVNISFTQISGVTTTNEIDVTQLTDADIFSIEDISNSLSSTYVISQDNGFTERLAEGAERSCRLRGITGNATDKAFKLSQTLTGSFDTAFLQELLGSTASFIEVSQVNSIPLDLLKISNPPTSAILIDDRFSFSATSVTQNSFLLGSSVSLGLISRYLSERQEKARTSRQQISVGEFIPVIEPFSFVEGTTGAAFGFAHLGYVIDRVENFSSGKREKKTITILGHTASSFIDSQIKYGTRYSYTVKALYVVTIPQILFDDGTPITSKILLTSAPATVADVVTEEFVPPPPPTDVSFNFDHSRNQLMIRWEFPVNPQQDVTRFQVFRRRSITEPFILLKELDFDFTESPASRSDAPLPINVSKSNFPIRRFIDHDFGRSSDYIYAICCVDAHGLVSNYSTQFRVTFSRRLNNIVVRSISSPGAPRSYPNLYLNTQEALTLDSIAGIGPTKMRIVFDPEYHDVTSEGRNLELLKFVENEAKYYVNVIDTDRAQQISIPIGILSGSV